MKHPSHLLNPYCPAIRYIPLRGMPLLSGLEYPFIFQYKKSNRSCSFKIVFVCRHGLTSLVHFIRVQIRAIGFQLPRERIRAGAGLYPLTEDATAHEASGGLEYPFIFSVQKKQP